MKFTRQANIITIELESCDCYGGESIEVAAESFMSGMVAMSRVDQTRRNLVTKEIMRIAGDEILDAVNSLKGESSAQR